ncbi:MAG: alpha/beta hydrolase [Erysipelotrichaceae bacterium]|nr:alpha/beta hydrolase [Erysipelotrichaceae bacterium]
MNKTHIILIHGTWCNGNVWKDFANGLNDMGLNVHTPSLRYHDLPYDEVLAKVGNVELEDYVNDIIDYALKLDNPPILLGHSLGCLIAQLVASKIKTKGMILLGPAPTGGMFAFYPTMVICFYKHFLRWGFWKKPMPPYKHAFFDYCMNEQDINLKQKLFDELVPESGRVYAQMAFPFFDKKRSAYVQFDKISCPVLIVSGTKDKMTVKEIAIKTSKKYKDVLLEIFDGADHMYESGKFKNKTLETIKSWLIEKNI